LLNVIGRFPVCDATSKEAESIKSAVNSMACSEWNEHLVSQSSVMRELLPLVASSSSIEYTVPLEDLGQFLAVFSRGTNMSVSEQWNLQMQSNPSLSNKGIRKKKELDLNQVLDDKTKRIWCYYFLEDYFRFSKLYCPPMWCIPSFEQIGVKRTRLWPEKCWMST
jgi:hypothetical protein